MNSDVITHSVSRIPLFVTPMMIAVTEVMRAMLPAVSHIELLITGTLHFLELFSFLQEKKEET